MKPAAVIGGLAVLLVMAAAVSFARSDQSLRVARDATVVEASERGRAAAATYRANLTIAVVAAAAESPSSSRRALEAAAAALERITTSTATLDDAELTASTSDLQHSHRRVATALADTEVDLADDLVTNEVLPLLDQIQRDLASASAAASARIQAEHASAGRTARMSSFVVALIAPMLGLWVYRGSVKRRLERDRLAAELTRQRDLAAAQQSLISGMSHQLRTPLTGIYGFAEALVSDSIHHSPDPEFVREAGSTILSESNRLRAMVDDILVTARHQAGDLAYDSVPYRIDTEVGSAAEPFLATGAEIGIVCDPAQVVGDRLRFRHVLRNLIDNAIRHGAPPVSVTGRHENGAYIVTVTDHGRGLDTDDVFRPFVHSGNEALLTGSLGLGLGVSRALSEGMGVDLTYSREEDTTRFTMTFENATEPVSADRLSARR